MSLQLTIIFPAFNEAENLLRYPKEVFPILDELGMSYEVLIVDDGSKDNTRSVAESLGNQVRVIPHERNLGLGAAIRTGITNAQGELIITMDSDLTFAPTLIPKLIARYKQGDVDVVSGSPQLAGFDENIPQYRIQLSTIASQIYSTLLGQKITSVSPILRLYKRADLLALDLHAIGFDINAEILFGLIRNQKKVAEIPAPLTQRIYGHSNLNYRKEIKRHLKLMRRMLLWKLFD